jgi:hypothetical protein
MVNEPTAQPPAMDIEGHAAFLYGTANGQLPVDRVGISMAWAGAKTDDKNQYREQARQELAAAAKRSGDHDAMKALHEAAVTATGGRTMAAMDSLTEPAREMALRSAAADQMAQSPDWRSLIVAAEDRTKALKELLELVDAIGDDYTVEDDQLARLNAAAAQVRELHGLRTPPPERGV